MRPEWKGDGYGYGLDPRVREDWLVDCRERVADYTADQGLGSRIDDGDACQAYLDNYYAGGSYGGYGYGQPMVMVPVMVRKPCVETVTTDYVPAPARRVIPRRAPRPDKRIRVAPDKRIPLK